MEHLLTPRQFYYPRGAIGARHIAEALRIPYEPVIQADFREWSSFSQSDMILEHLGYPEEPRLRGAAIAERTSLSTNGITWQPTLHLREPQLCLHLQSYPEMSNYLKPRRMRFSQTPHLLPLQHTPQVHMPEAIHPTSPLTQSAPPRLSAFIADTEHCSGFYYSADGHYSWRTRIRSLLLQAQHTTILHQIQQHLSVQTPLGHDRSAPSEPLVPDEETIPAEAAHIS
ncbi:hypothetical protein CK203_111104 [Vitis vinifera]|uniref:Uncharacterized protein n=1 Tax=Vitis vinifera TaxID=29760 RepID=A0A438BP63_VITVI|nr:hypothetical protein CK203_111104 [Vitis vinifera]